LRFEITTPNGGCVKTADLTVLPGGWSCRQNRRIVMTTVMTTEQRAYLRAEHERLRMEHLRLRGEFEALRKTGFSSDELRVQMERLRAHFNLLEKHLVGLEWMSHAPWQSI